MLNRSKINFFKIISDKGKIINKEFIPIIFILIMPTIAFLEGYGIKSLKFCCKDMFYFCPIVLAIIINMKNKIKFNKLFFLLLFLTIFKNTQIIKIEKYFNGNYLMLFISYIIIILFYLLISM